MITWLLVFIYVCVEIFYTSYGLILLSVPNIHAYFYSIILDGPYGSHFLASFQEKDRTRSRAKKTRFELAE